jgi:hypothetical protein
MLKTTIKTTKIQWKTQKIDTERRREGGEHKKLKEPGKNKPRRGGVSFILQVYRQNIEYYFLGGGIKFRR